MASFIELTDLDGDKIIVNVEHIRLVSQLDNTSIFVGSFDAVFRVQESYLTVKRKINNAIKKGN